MQDTELFLALAEIAGVFVGFGALISVRSGGPTEVDEVALMRGVVTMGLLTIVAALAPVTLGRYGLTEHQVWALSSGVYLAGLFGMFVVMIMTPEYRANVAARSSRGAKEVEDAASVLLDIAMVFAPIVIVLGVAPDVEAALYFTVVVLTLLGAGWVLLDLVFSQRRPQSASDPAALPATGGSKA